MEWGLNFNYLPQMGECEKLKKGGIRCGGRFGKLCYTLEEKLFFLPP